MILMLSELVVSFIISLDKRRVAGRCLEGPLGWPMWLPCILAGVFETLGLISNCKLSFQHQEIAVGTVSGQLKQKLAMAA